MRCLAAGFLLARELGVRSDDDIVTGRWGKPELRKGFPHFNLSHSGNYVALAIADAPIGIDIEQVQPFDWAVVRRCFNMDEREWLLTQATDEAFYRLWTGKEAVMKATGKGFSLDPASFCVLPTHDGEYEIDGKHWNLTWRNVDGHVLCVACVG